MIEGLFSLREEEIFKTLRALKGCNFAIIGGYAVNAYALPRFSADCDIVVKDKHELEKIEEILGRIGYKKELPSGEAQYSGSFSRHGKKLGTGFAVSMDILIRGVTDRMTGVTFAAEWIFKNSGMRALKGKTIREELKLRIINIDALLVMKIISCRPTDVRDVFMMATKAEDREWIKSEIAIRYGFKDRITKIVEKVSSKQFKDGLSGVYGYVDRKVFEKYRKEIMAFSRE